MKKNPNSIHTLVFDHPPKSPAEKARMTAFKKETSGNPWNAKRVKQLSPTGASKYAAKRGKKV
jgi:hypothetical protein